MPARKTTIVFVHGWSVTDTATYGALPARLQNEAAASGLDVSVHEIFLGRYISFHDEVRLEDVSRAFDTAVAEQMAAVIKRGDRFVCITHSTGGPVIRDWWQRFYADDSATGTCPMSHLVMLAPANYGSALAQLGKSRLGRLKSWFEGVEPGQGLLDWLELGSPDSWKLNTKWITGGASHVGARGVFPFVITGQTIDRSLYDNLNSYTGEMGSDGVVRVAAANLRGQYIRLEQQVPRPVPGRKGEFKADEMVVTEFAEAPASPLRILAGKAHSGKERGIMRSVKASLRDAGSRETVSAILECIAVRTKAEYDRLGNRFAGESDAVQAAEKLEVEKRLLRSEALFFHDRHAMVVFRVTDHLGYPVDDFDVVLTAGPEADPNHLPRGFFVDRQRNHVARNTVTYYFNYDIMHGAAEVSDGRGKVVREKLDGAGMLGLRLSPRPSDGFVHYLPCEIEATRDLLHQALKPNSTTLIDIRLRRVVYKNVFRLDKMTATTKAEKFAKTKPGDGIVR